MKPTTIIIFLCAIVLTILAMQNTDAVVINLLFWHPSVPLIILVFVVMGIGFAAGFVVRSMIKRHDDAA